jgi:phage terminase large subunit GpA-like protein
VENANPDSGVREWSLLKGVQITATTMMESIFFYYSAHVKTVSGMYASADKEMAKARVENYFVPMLNYSGFGNIIQSNDEGNSRKTGKTANHLQWAGGGVLYPVGANNADKLRSISILLMLMDEIDAYKEIVGKDGDPVKLLKDRTAAYEALRKIFMASTPLWKHNSKIFKEYQRGDQRKYFVHCLKCGRDQYLVWDGENKENGRKYGFKWDYDSHNRVDHSSVRYECMECGHGHQEHDKARLFSPDHGAQWRPTATAVAPGVRSYHLPAFYSPIGMQPWARNVQIYTECYDIKNRRVIDIGGYQRFYNNILGWPFEQQGHKIKFEQVSAHRPIQWRYGTVPNGFAAEFMGSKVLQLVSTVDVHKKFLAVSVQGITRGLRTCLVDYFEIEGEDFSKLDEPGWRVLQTHIEERIYPADDGAQYPIAITGIDSGYAYSTVVAFCEQYERGVYPIVGRDRRKTGTLREFSKFRTQNGIDGFTIQVDHYKDRIAPVLRRDWEPEHGTQAVYHFNAPIDATDKQLKELTVERLTEKVDERGAVTRFWFRPSGARNELWDLTVYAHAMAEITAWLHWAQYKDTAENVDWAEWWDYLETHTPFYTPGSAA